MDAESMKELLKKLDVAYTYIFEVRNALLSGPLSDNYEIKNLMRHDIESAVLGRLSHVSEVLSSIVDDYEESRRLRAEFKAQFYDSDGCIKILDEVV